ncbi:MAG: c-type cytochrome [Bacteroidales bacterium]|nr:c-type cytochrome [Bacteroidales bacterium]
MKIQIITRMLTVVAICSALAFSGLAQKPSKWVAPDNAKTLKNPSPAAAASIATGKELYTKSCKSCHGIGGLGDGPKASVLDVSCNDFTSKDFKAQTDGEIFYKITNGKDKMPAFSKSIPSDADRWALVNYIRTLK